MSTKRIKGNNIVLIFFKFLKILYLFSRNLKENDEENIVTVFFYVYLLK